MRRCFVCCWLQAAANAAGAADGEYLFAEHNPFLGDAAAFEKGRDLFKRGLLSEAALALEAEVRAELFGGASWFSGVSRMKRGKLVVLPVNMQCALRLATICRLCCTCVSHSSCLSVAQVRQHPENAPAWRLLGTVHAENDDDRQVGYLLACL